MSDSLLSFIIFLFGLAVGSFLNCLIYRLEEGKSFWKGRSYCPHCKHKLQWQDLIPVLSFLILRSKCRYCGNRISLQYPLVELATGILFVSITYNLQLTTYNLQNLLVFSYWLFVVCCLLIVFVYDLKHYIIPDKIIYPAIASAFLYQLFGIWNFGFILEFGFWNLDFKALVNPLASAFLASLFFFLIVFISGGKWLGVGDIKLAFLMGLILGWPNILVALFSAFFIGAIMGVGLIIAAKKTLKSEVPFGPFLVSGTFIALFFGQNLVSWYLNFLTI